MPSFLVRVGPALLLCVLLLGTAPASDPLFSSSVPPDTVTSTVAAGTPLVRPLPTSLKDAPIARYMVLNGPALSGAAGYSFTWITRDTAPGTYTISLRADHPDVAPDTLIIQITVEPE
ncbi:MAG: hypothetical protein BRD55_00650 [Bacteroidetes bacterium SW_9_63_38]|nr:MAG: hypothetical protein BRD55_00650 [Bacteroidetes bacterium SW_9_63_38]